MPSLKSVLLFLLLLPASLLACREQTPQAAPTVAPTTQPATAIVIPATVTVVVPTETSVPPTATPVPPSATPVATAIPEPTATATADPEAETTASPTATPAATLEPIAGEPDEVVRDFLDSYMREEAESEILRYLDQGLRDRVAAGETVGDLLGVTEDYRSFALTLLDDGSRDGEAAVLAALSYAEPAYVRFLLTRHENDSWYISAIEPQEGAPEEAGDPGEVVNEFLTSLLYDRSGSSSLPYLSQALQQQVSGGRSVLDLLGVERVYSSYSYSIINDGRRSGTATVEAVLEYAAGPVTVTFTLTQEGDTWRISQISSSS